MSPKSAYRLRANPSAQAFRIAWEQALDIAIRTLADKAMARAI